MVSRRIGSLICLNTRLDLTSSNVHPLQPCSTKLQILLTVHSDSIPSTVWLNGGVLDCQLVVLDSHMDEVYEHFFI